MMRAAVRWRTLAAYLTEDVSEELMQNDELVHLLDHVDALFEERDSWFEPGSERHQERLTDAYKEGYAEAKEQALMILETYDYREKLFKQEPTDAWTIAEDVNRLDAQESVQNANL